MSRIFDKSFRYVKAIDTDVRKTIKKELKRQKDEREARAHKVTQIMKKRA